MPSLPFLVTTRMIAGFIAVIPLYVVGLLSSYLATRTIATGYFGQSTGTYDYYFHLFLPPVDVLWSFGKVLVFSVIVVLVHCYYGYTASGGPAGVGVAVGRAVRLAIVVGQRRRLLPLPGHLGRHHHGADRRMTHATAARTRLRRRARRGAGAVGAGVPQGVHAGRPG